jgi:2OG-Fe(II) oxygenase superfamily
MNANTLWNEQIMQPSKLDALSVSFKTAKPFPHLIIDGLFSNDTLTKLADEIALMSRDKWVRHEDADLKKLNSRSAAELGETGQQLTALLHSATFLYLLSEISGIWNLLPDPYLQGGGYHVFPPGGHFSVHADRTTAYMTGLARRLSLIVYLNKSWKHEYGGQLELWNADATHREVIVEPIFNRTIIFEIGDRYYHGVPTPVACPKGQSRNSFVAYYHTLGINQLNDVRPQSTVYAPSSHQHKDLSLKNLIRDITPPVMWRGLVRLKNGKNVLH